MLTLQSAIEIFGMISGGIYLVSQVKITAENNQRAIEALKKDLTDLIEKNNSALENLFEAFKMHQSEMMSKEISHMKDLMAVNATETRESIRRLEAKQEQSNHVRERVSLLEASLRSLHKRLDLSEPPELPE